MQQLPALSGAFNQKQTYKSEAIKMQTTPFREWRKKARSSLRVCVSLCFFPEKNWQKDQLHGAEFLYGDNPSTGWEMPALLCNRKIH